jgi:transposase
VYDDEDVMRPTSDVRQVFELRDAGCSKSEIARRTGASRSQIREWLAVGLDVVLHPPMRERAAAIGGEDGASCRA